MRAAEQTLNVLPKSTQMSIEKRIEVVRLLAQHLGPEDITDRHVTLDRVDKSYLLHAAEGMATELTLDILGAVAIGAMDCRLVFLEQERTREIDDLVNRGLGVYMNRVD